MRVIGNTIILSILLSLFSLSARSEAYELTTDSLPQEGVPKGTVSQHRWTESTVYPGTERDYWVYVPAQYDAAKPACVMVFQDGGNYVSLEKSFRVPTVFDNLIHQGDMPVTIGVFINPGVFPSDDGDKARRNRSVEYDTLSDAYVRFVLDEILTEVGKSYNLKDDPKARAIGGISSGGICAFTAAWERPDAFPQGS